MNEAASGRNGTCKRIRILIADDSVAFRNVLCTFLDLHPQVEVVGMAVDGEDALALVAGVKPDLVLMDLQMPRLNGLQATRKIRAEFPGVRIIVITLHYAAELKVASVMAGADRILVKRCLRDELPGAIAQLFPRTPGEAKGDAA
jgi:DNA-binding NarL/FixJ family response regulator